MAKTKSVDGVEHPASDFAAVGDPEDISTWHLPIFDAKHARLAVQMFGRTQGMSAEMKKHAKGRIAAAAKKHGVDTSNFADFNNQWIQIFRAGDYGDKGKWTEDDLDTVIRNFAAGMWKPPLVLGHPQEDSPAMGWVGGLKREGAVLLAQMESVQPELEASVQSGRFPNRSAAFYLDPKGSGPALRHVGFLGATPPEVKGLEAINFSDGEFVAIEFSEEDVMDPKELKKTVGDNVREFFAELFKGENRPAAGTFTEEQVQARIQTASTDLEKRLETKFGERLQATEQRLSAASEDSKRASAKAFVERMKAANKWVPAFSEAGLDKVLEHLAVSGAKVKFGEAGKEQEALCFEQLCRFIETQRAIVPVIEIAGVKQVRGKNKVVQFNEAKGIVLDPSSVTLSERADEIATEKKIPFGDALKMARRELGDSPAAVGGIAAGAA